MFLIIQLKTLSPKNSLRKYADDTTLLVPQHTNCDIEAEFEHIRQWSDANKLTINKTKCVELILWRTTKIKCRYSVPNMLEIQRVEYVKLLGVFITSNLTWSMQVDYMLRTVSQKFYLIKQIRGMSLNMVSVNQVYNALVLSRIQYALPAYYDFLLEVDKDRIDALMRKAKRWALTSVAVGIETLAKSADNKLFSKAVNPGHCLHPLIPNKPDNKIYSLRSNQVLYKIPLIKHSGLEKSFISTGVLRMDYEAFLI